MKWSLLFLVLPLGGCATNKPLPVAIAPTALQQISHHRLTPRSEVEISAVEFSPNAKWLAVGTLQRAPNLSGNVTVREVATNRIIKSWKLKGCVKYLAFSPDGGTLAVAGAQSKLTVWKWRTKQLLHSENQNTDFAGENRVAISFSPDGKWLATAAGGELLDIRSWKHRKSLKNTQPPSANSDHLIEYVHFTPDGRFLLLGFADDDMVDNFRYCFVNLKTGLGRKIHYFSWNPPAFSPDGSLLSANDLSAFPCVWWWNGRTLKTKQTFRSKQFQPQVFSPDNRFVAGLNVADNEDAGSGPVEIWSVATGKRVYRFKQRTRRLLWLDANTLIAGDEQGVHRLPITDGQFR